MSFIRPEVKTFLLKWREAIISGVILLGSLQAAAMNTGFIKYMSLSLIHI